VIVVLEQVTLDPLKHEPAVYVLAPTKHADLLAMQDAPPIYEQNRCFIRSWAKALANTRVVGLV